MDDVLDIRLKSAIEAHGFIGRQFSESGSDDMRNAHPLVEEETAH